MASQKVHGITIDLDVNTSAVNESFKDINKALISTQKELTQVDKLLKIDPKNTTLLAQKQYLLSGAIEDTKDKLVQLAKAKKQADSTGEIDKSSKQYRDLERDMINTKNALDRLTRQFNENEDAIKGVANESDNLGNNLKKASDNASSFGDMLKAKVIGEAIIGGVKTLANAFIDISKGIYSSVRDSGKLADDINTLASQYNLSTKEIQQFMKASELVDVELSTITKSFNKLTKNMTSTSKETTNAFKKLNVSVKDSKGNLRDSNDVFYETIEALSQIKNETEQDSLAMAIFGKSASDLGSLINGGSEQLAEFNKYLEENNLLLSQEELDNLNEMNDSFDILNATFDSVKQKIASELAPVIKPLVEELTTFIVEHKDSIIDLAKQLIDKFTSGDGQKMFENITQLVDDIGTFIDDTPKVVESLELIASPLKIIAEIIEGISWFFNGNFNTRWSELYGDTPFITGSYMNSGGFGALKSGGFASGGITLNATFNNNGSLDEASAIKYANIMTQIINDNLGGMV